MSKSQSATVPHAAAIEVEWVGGLEFQAGRPRGPRIRIDGDATTAPGPFDVLLASIATCASTDVVTILQKQRKPLEPSNSRSPSTAASVPPSLPTHRSPGRWNSDPKGPPQTALRSVSDPIDSGLRDQLHFFRILRRIGGASPSERRRANAKIPRRTRHGAPR